MWNTRHAYGISVEKYLRKRVLGRLRRRYEGNIKINFRKTGCGDGR
jgi:hypothetical protein